MEISLSGNPVSTNHLYKRHGHIIYMTREGKELKEAYMWQIKTMGPKQPIKGPIKLKVDLFFKDNRRRDIDNYNKILLDSATGLLWEDDSQIQELTITKHVDADNPHILLTF